MSNYGSAALVGTEAQTVLIDESPGEGVPLVRVENLTEEEDKPVFRDVWFAIFFLAHLGFMVYLGVAYGSFGIEEIDVNNVTAAIQNAIDDDVDISEQDLKQLEVFAHEAEAYIQVYPTRIFVFLVLPCALLAYVSAYLSTAFFIPSCPKVMVSACLLGTLVWTLLIAVSVCIAAQSVFAIAGSVVMLGLVGYYVKIVWKMIPFAAVNLRVALLGISANAGMYIVALLFSVVGFIWYVFWFYATIGLLSFETQAYNNTLHDESAGGSGTHKHQFNDYDDDDYDGPQGFTFFLLLVSLYWTSSVLLNTVQVTVAGVMGTWCYDYNDARSCCSPAVTSSLYRSCTFSFGSICFGSLLQAIMTALRVIVENARNQRNDNDNACGAILLCLLECLIRLFEDIIEYFNQWSYVYVGIYGYSYLESGRRVVELFRAKGWTAIITNRLVQYVLGFTTFTVSIATGLAASLVDALVTQSHGTDESYILGPLVGPKYWAFGIGFVIGIAVCSVMMNVIQGAVNTLIVCFADDPGKLEDNHPEEAHAMVDSWTALFPDANMQPAQYSVVV